MSRDHNNVNVSKDIFEKSENLPINGFWSMIDV